MKGKFVKLFSILLLVSLLLTSCSKGRGIEAYKKGDYATAVKELENAIYNEGYHMFVDALYFLGMAYEKTGNSSKGKPVLTKAYEIIVRDKSDREEFEKKYPSEYNELLKWAEEQKKLQEEEIKLQKKMANVGNWTLYQVDDRLNKVKVSNSFYYNSTHIPKKSITVREDGTISPLFDSNNASNMKWQYSESNGFQVLASDGSPHGGITSQGYLQINATTINSKGQPAPISIYYKKN